MAHSFDSLDDLHAFLLKEKCFSTICAHCFKASPQRTFQKCARCRDVFYCGRECQAKDWPFHKTVCGAIAAWKAKTKTERAETRRTCVLIEPDGSFVQTEISDGDRDIYRFIGATRAGDCDVGGGVLETIGLWADVTLLLLRASKGMADNGNLIRLVGRSVEPLRGRAIFVDKRISITPTMMPAIMERADACHAARRAAMEKEDEDDDDDE